MTFLERAASAARRWPLVVLCMLLGIGTGVAATKLVSTSYTADAKIFVVVAGKQTPSDMSQASQYAASQMSSYEMAVSSPIVLDPVIQQLHLDTTAVELAKKVTATATKDSFVLDIMVTDSTAEKAKATANAIAAQMGTAIKQLTPVDAAGAKPLGSTTITPAQVDEAAGSSALVRNVGGLGLLGTIAGVALALLLEARSIAAGRLPRRSGTADRTTTVADGGLE